MARPKTRMGAGCGLFLVLFTVPFFWIAFSRPGRPDWMFVIIPAVFALSGLGAIVRAAGRKLARSNFRVAELVVTESAFAIGGVAKVKLVLDPKSPVDLKGATVTVRAIEEAEYRAGTDSTVYTNVVHEWSQPIELGQRLIQAVEQVIEIPIPETVPPTFNGKNNWLYTECKVQLDIPHWPDLLLERELIIAPERV